MTAPKFRQRLSQLIKFSNTKSLRRTAALCLSLSLFVAAPTNHATADTDATYIASSGNYDNDANWDLGLVPLNNGTLYNVFLPNSVTVNFDVDAPSTIQDLTIPSSSTLIINPGHSLTVADDLHLSGAISTDNGTFIATSPGAAFEGTRATLSATGGGTISIAATSYTNNTPDNVTILSASGSGSMLDLSSLQTLTTTDTNGNRTRTIVAENGASINLSSLQSINLNTLDDDMQININSGGTIDLSNLDSLNTPNAGYDNRVTFNLDTTSYSLPALTTNGNTFFNMPDGSTLDLPLLISQDRGGYNVPTNGQTNLPQATTLNGTSVSIGTNGAFNAPNVTTFTGGTLTYGDSQTLNVGSLDEIDNSRFILSGGVSLSVSDTEYHAAGVLDQTIFSAQGAGTNLDLSSINTLTVGDIGGNRYRRISATANGHINLSGLQTIVAGNVDDDLYIDINSGGTINLSNLTNIDSPDSPYDNFVRLTVDAPNYTLPMLMNAERFEIVPNSGATVDLPELLAADRSTLNVADSGQINTPKLTQLTNGTINIGSDGTLNAPLLTNISGTTFNYGPDQTANTGALSEIDNARLLLSGGVSLSVSDTEYHAGGVLNQSIFHAEGAGTNLDLSSINTLTVGDLGGNRYRRITATANGHINFSGLQTIVAGSVDDDLYIDINSGGTIDLSNLTTIDSADDNPYGNSVRFTVDAPNYSLPMLMNAERFEIVPNSGATVDLPELLAADRSTLNVADSGQINTPKLTQFSNGTINIGTNGTLNAPMLTNISGTTFNYGPDQTAITGTLTEIDNARLLLSGGVSLSVAGTEYHAGGVSNQSIFHAEGAGTSLDLSSINTLTVGDVGGNRYRRITATADGHINFSGLQTIVAGNVDDDLYIDVNSGGTIDLSNLSRIDSLDSPYGNTVNITVESTGSVTLGNLRSGAQTNITIDGVGSSISASGSLVLEDTSTLAVTDGGTLIVAGNYTFKTQTESNINTANGVLEFNGSISQLLEVGSEDLGLTAPSNNFEWGQLVVGTDAQDTVVHLFDISDNGNRNSGFEALYLNGMGGSDGLIIRGGSTLVLNNINAYAFLSGEMVHLNSLFGVGENVIEFSDGFIELERPSTPGDFDLDGDVDVLDINLLSEAIIGTSPDPRFDLNFDLALDQDDLRAHIEDIIGTAFGDANLDFVVNLVDLAKLATNFGQSGKGWEHGDFTADGLVNLEDLAKLATNFGTDLSGALVEPATLTAQSVAIPEPSTLVLSTLTLVGLLRRRSCQ